jgi:hypothetical protein
MGGGSHGSHGQVGPTSESRYRPVAWSSSRPRRVIQSLEGQRAQFPFWSVASAAFVCCGAILVALTFLGGHLLTAAHNQSDEPNYLYFAHNLIHGKYAVAGEQADGSYL